MKTFRLKIARGVVLGLIVVVVILAGVFWFIGTKPADGPENADRSRSQQRPVPTAEELYQTALTCTKEIAGTSYRDYEKVLESCSYLVRQYPDSTEAEKAKELIKEMPRRYQEQFNNEMLLLNPPESKAKKSRPLRRRPAMRYPRRNNVRAEKTGTLN